MYNCTVRIILFYFFGVGKFQIQKFYLMIKNFIG